MRRFLILFFVLLLFSTKSIYSQTVTLSDQTALPCGTLSYPMVAESLPDGIGAVSLFIQIDTNVIKYTGYTVGTLTGCYVNLSNNLIGVAWSDANGANINGTLLTLNIKYKGGTSALDFTPSCEISTAVPIETVPVTYVDGSVGPKPTTTYYVNSAVPSSGNGLSWGTALKKISEATNKPLTPGDNVLIMPGNYTDTVVIKTNGTEIVPLTFNVSVSDTNKITFPSTSDLGCVDAADYPGHFYVYLSRSWKGNNGVYKITQVNKTLKYVIVEGAAFVPESGDEADSSMLQASIGFPNVYEKYSSNPTVERIVLSSSGISGERAAIHIGKPTSAGDFNVDAANYNIIDGIDITGADQVGLRIQNSKFNVCENSWIHDLDSIGVLISGNSVKPANNNFILNNRIYNTNKKAVKVGIQNETSANNRANLNHFIGNEIYSTSGSYINYINAVDICRYTGYTVLEKNTFRNFKLKNTEHGAIEVKNDVRKFLAYSNYLKNIDRVNTIGNHSMFYLQANGDSNQVINNVMVDTAALDNDFYAFWVNGSGTYTGGLIGYNTIYNVDNGFKLISGSSAVDFRIKDNIVYLDATAPQYFSITGTGLYSVSYNFYRTDPGAYLGETGRLTGDPQFLLPTFFQSPFGFSLLSSSTCYHTGNPITEISADYRGQTRDASTPSRGAFENIISSAIWTGEVSTNWHDYRNWNIEMVPLTTFDVTVPHQSFDPVISNSNVTIKSLQVSPPAVLQLRSPHTLTLTN